MHVLVFGAISGHDPTRVMTKAFPAFKHRVDGRCEVRRCVATARALQKDPLIMIIDGATAPLDAGTEGKLQRALASVTRARHARPSNRMAIRGMMAARRQMPELGRTALDELPVGMRGVRQGILFGA